MISYLLSKLTFDFFNKDFLIKDVKIPTLYFSIKSL